MSGLGFIWGGRRGRGRALVCLLCACVLVCAGSFLDAKCEVKLRYWRFPTAHACAESSSWLENSIAGRSFTQRTPHVVVLDLAPAELPT